MLLFPFINRKKKEGGLGDRTKKQYCIVSYPLTETLILTKRIPTEFQIHY